MINLSSEVTKSVFKKPSRGVENVKFIEIDLGEHFESDKFPFWYQSQIFLLTCHASQKQ